MKSVWLILLLILSVITTNSTVAAVVLMYHRFGEQGLPSTNISMEQFRAHLQHLASHDYQVWPLARITAYLDSNTPLPDRVVALTVDDAYASVYEQAYPLLKERQWPLTVFVSTDAIDKQLRGYMSWEQMRQMQQHQVTFANHSRSHGHLIAPQPGESNTAWQQRVAADINHARQRLQQELGQAPALFAYPYGEYSPALKQLVAELGYHAFGQQSGAIGLSSDPRLLPRFPMAERFADIGQFRIKVAALPFPVRDSEPESPVLAAGNLQPTLAMTVNTGQLPRLDQLACYISSQGQAPVNWRDKAAGHFTLQANKPLAGRRNRYNCTAPSAQSGRYYWFSQLWINPAIEEP